MAIWVIEDIFNPRTDMPVQGLKIFSITPTGMCYLFYYTERPTILINNGQGNK
jgi:hypothetical protein